MILLAFTLCAQLALPPQAPEADAPPGRPRVGLVLSGGGARGAAHVGVLRFLEEQRVPVDFVIGTSMGAIVGGFYCSGLSPDEIKEVLSQTDWLTLFNDDPSREYMSWRRKLDDHSLLVDLEIGVSSGGIEFPSGFIQGQKISPLFRSLASNGLVEEDFDKLRLPYRAVAMDVVTGETVVLARGDLAQAMRASMSIAGAFAPVDIDGRLLVDGGYVDNLPVDIAQELGAEIIIAVDVGTPPVDERNELKSLFAFSSQVQDVVVAVGRRAARARLDGNDVLIVPELGKISFSDFGLALNAVEIGYTAAVSQAQALAPLSVDEEAWKDFLARQRAPKVTMPRVRSVSFENQSKLSTETLKRLVSVPVDGVLDVEAVRIDLATLYGLGIFESADFRVARGEDGVDLVYMVREKSWGPNYLRFGLALSEAFDGRSNYGIGVGVTVVPVNDFGAEWRTELHIGNRLGIATEFYQPIDHAMRWFVAPYAAIGRTALDLDRDSSPDEEYTIDQRGVGLDFGRMLGGWGEARIGIAHSSGTIDADSSLTLPDEGDFKDTSYAASVRWDTLDERDFPLSGIYGGVSSLLTRQDLGADQDSDRAHFALAAYATFGKITGSAAVEFGTSFDTDLPLQQEFQLGGFGRLSGFAANSISGDDLALARIGGYVGIGGRAVPLYAGATLEIGNAWDVNESVSMSTLEPSASLFFGADTPLGPFILGIGAADEGEAALFLLLGQRP